FGLAVSVAFFSFESEGASASARTNLLGTPGHWLSRELYQALGSTVYLFFVAWFVVVLLLLVRKSWFTWTRRLAGWLLLVPSAAACADRLGTTWLPGPLTGSGGALGAFLPALLEEKFTPLEASLILSCAIAVGLMLAVDTLIF